MLKIRPFQLVLEGPQSYKGELGLNDKKCVWFGVSWG